MTPNETNTDGTERKFEGCEECNSGLFGVRRNESDMLQVRCASCDSLIAQAYDPKWFQPPTDDRSQDTDT